MPRYVEVDEDIDIDSVKYLKSKGVNMEDLFSLVKEVEGLKRQQVEERHALTDTINELRRKVDAFTGGLEGIHAEVQGVRADFTKVAGTSVSPSQIRSIAFECLRDPAGCATVRVEAQKAVSEALAKAEAEEEEAGSEKQEHQSALDYLRCPECRPKFVQASSRVPEFTSAIIDQLGDRDVEGLIQKLQEQGYNVEGPKTKPKDWLTGEA